MFRPRCAAPPQPWLLLVSLSRSASLQAVAAEVVALDPEVNRRQKWEFTSGEDRWWHATLSKLVTDLKAFTDESSGGLFTSGVSEKHGWGIVKRAEFARTIEERSVSGAEARRPPIACREKSGVTARQSGSSSAGRRR